MLKNWSYGENYRSWSTYMETKFQQRASVAEINNVFNNILTFSEETPNTVNK